MPSRTQTRRMFVQGGAAAALAIALGVSSPALAQVSEESPKQPPEGSPAFERFRWSFFEDKDSPRNGLDSAALRQLEGDERRRAEDMLIRFLPDDRAIIGLGELRSRRAEGELLKLFFAERRARTVAKLIRYRDLLPYRLVELAKALWQIRPDQRWLAAAADILASGDHEHYREEAAMALSVFRDPAAVRALVTALDDPASLVRHHAARSLLTIHGLFDVADLMNARPEQPMFRVMSDEPARRESGKRDILAAIATRPISPP